jgi:uncharacterized repeat protein (TIGR03803 family)
MRSRYLPSVFVLTITLVFANLAEAKAKETVIHRFNYTDGATPAFDLISDEQGNLYGTTLAGGEKDSGCSESGCGTVFELSPSAGGGWTYSLLYSFKGGTDSANPYGRLTLDKKGNLYGVAATDGPNGAGTVFKFTRGSDGTWTESILHAFPSYGEDGYFPAGDLAFDAKGNLYGSTLEGANNAANGTVYQLSPQKDGTWNETVIYYFDHSDDGSECGGVVLDKHGNIYGETSIGNGAGSGGTAFEISPAAGGWSEKVLSNFSQAGDPATLSSPLTLDSSGDLYGSSLIGGKEDSGTIYRLKKVSGGQWQLSIVHSFSDNLNRAIGPPRRVVFDSEGNIVGTSWGGLYGAGSVWELSPQSGGGWSGKVLYSFENGSDGSQPAGVVIGKDGNLYGPTEAGGGRYGYGTIFEVVP